MTKRVLGRLDELETAGVRAKVASPDANRGLHLGLQPLHAEPPDENCAHTHYSNPVVSKALNGLK